jgi:diaminohydroxyphosphoribosylaminopyrimidine deaminase / 5-amino-6-(5-phosphoribosylamino)uracil reductase
MGSDQRRVRSCPVRTIRDPSVTDEPLQQAAWRALLAAAAIARAATVDPGADDSPDFERALIGIGAGGVRVPPQRTEMDAWLVSGLAGWSVAPSAPAAVRALLDLYAPVCAPAAERPLTIAHLGQSLDGCIATASGDSYYVTGPDNVVHLHRLRALCDAVIVGASTVERDDPLLTVRHVEGENPLRVIIDPRRRLGLQARVFADDAETLLVYGDDAPCSGSRGAADVITLPVREGRLDLEALLAELRARGCRAVFVEGGGATVSSFVEAGLLDRLQIAIAPLVTGSGRPGLTLPARDRIAECLRPAHRVFTMGGDVLFDCDLRTSGVARASASGELSRVV